MPLYHNRGEVENGSLTHGHPLRYLRAGAISQMRKKTSSRTLIPLLLSLLFIGLLSGCANPLARPLKVDYNPVSGAEKTSLSRSVPILIRPFTDKRPEVAQGADPLEIGSIDATVQDMYGSRLILSTSPAALVTEGFKKYLAAEGYTVVSTDKVKSSFSGIILRGEIREFRLDIGAKDNIEIQVYAEFRDKESAAIIWSGLTKEKNSRYAGVFGDSRARVSRYISGTLSNVFRKTIERARPGIEKMGRAGKGNHNGNGNDGYEGHLPETGRLIVKTVPVRTKVYINGVYYGLSPMTLKLKPGIYNLILRKDGFYEFRERIAVGSERATEMETTLKEEK